MVGLAICLVDDKAPLNSKPPASLGTVSVGTGDAENKTRQSGQALNGDVATKSPHALTNHIRFFKNGQPMGNGVAFDGIRPGTYFPSVSCYMNGSARLNFGPYFVCPPENLPDKIDLRPISELCPSPPSPEEVVERVMSGGGVNNGAGKRAGGMLFSSKRNNDGIAAAFRELARAEATARRNAHSRHLELHQREVAAMRRERALPSSDLEGRQMPRSL